MPEALLPEPAWALSLAPPGTPPIPLGSRGRRRSPYRRRMQRYFPRRSYGQRWLVETVFSVIKRKFGEALTARTYWQQVKQAFLRGIVYDCYRAVQLGLMLWRWLWHRGCVTFAN